MPGPYMVTATRPQEVREFCDPLPVVISREVNATIEDIGLELIVRSLVPISHPDFDRHLEAARSMPEEGGTIGPLPDGTEIEVKPVEWDVLREVLTPEQRDRGVTGAETIAAANAYFEAEEGRG